MVRDRVQQVIGREHHDPDSVAILDETSHVKKGDKTPGVQRQWCGTKGTTDNCLVTVHLVYAAGGAAGAGEFRTLLDSELFLPKGTWSEDRARCRAAGIPDHLSHRPKWRIALEMIDRALSNGVRPGWLTFDDRAVGTHAERFAARVRASEVPREDHAAFLRPHEGRAILVQRIRAHARADDHAVVRCCPRLARAERFVWERADPDNAAGFSPVERLEPIRNRVTHTNYRGPIGRDSERQARPEPRSEKADCMKGRLPSGEAGNTQNPCHARQRHRNMR
jgi:hypothetical protein